MFVFESADLSRAKMVVVQDQDGTCVRMATTLHRSVVRFGKNSKKAEFPRMCEANLFLTN